jgi:2-polyprenyl-6-methoxyphenol hydroxylase-like FAD-dependent oxidoreductase
MATTLPILIAGGGIGGLAAASLLAQDGHQVNVLEQSAAFGEIGAGMQRELRNQRFQSGTESADSAGLKWMYTGIDPKRLFA